jgi:hypothetical protein
MSSEVQIDVHVCPTLLLLFVLLFYESCVHDKAISTGNINAKTKQEGINSVSKYMCICQLLLLQYQRETGAAAVIMMCIIHVLYLSLNCMKACNNPAS